MILEMQRIDRAEILDSDQCPPEEVKASLTDLDRVNRWFGGVATTRALIERVASAEKLNRVSLLEVAAGTGKVPLAAARKLARRGMRVEVTLLDVKTSHLPPGTRAVAADALHLPFPDSSFDLVSCNLFAHHLVPAALGCFIREALRVCRRAVLINDLIRSRIHLALVYAGFVLMRSHVSRVDGATSVRRAYVPEEIRAIIRSAFDPACTPRVEISRHYLFRMGVIIWKNAQSLSL
jgi:ubiquinone/menaquinone biosynthesis C-methylase UbiE